MVIKELKGAIVGPVLLLSGNILGLVVPIFFPLNYGGLHTGITGMMHWIIVMLTGFIALRGMIAMWRGLRKVEEWKGYDVYSLITFILTVIFTMILVIATGS